MRTLTLHFSDDALPTLDTFLKRTKEARIFRRAQAVREVVKGQRIQNVSDGLQFTSRTLKVRGGIISPSEQISRWFLLLAENLSASNYPGAAYCGGAVGRNAPRGTLPQATHGSSPCDRAAPDQQLSGGPAGQGVYQSRTYHENPIHLRYLTDRELRRTVQLQLNKGEYRHKLPRRIFFADQGEFTTGDYEEIMNKASCLSLVSNAILYWNTIKITEIVDNLRAQGEAIDEETLSHISLLPFRHVVPNGMYFIEDVS